MIELRNRQYMTIIDCVAGAALEMGQVIKLQWFAGRDLITAMKATAAADVSAITGPLFAYWINDRSSSTAYKGGTDGLTFTLNGASDDDSIHYIPSGSRMLAVGGKGVAELRFFANSLDTEYASTLPDPGTTLKFSSDESKLCSSGNGSVVDKAVAFVLENDGVSVAVIVG